MNAIERQLRRLDAAQQRHRPLAFAFGLYKKYGDDNAGSLATLLAHAMFLTVFPLLLLVVTITSLVLSHDPSARATIASSAFGQFPIVGAQLQRSVHVLHRTTVIGGVFGLLGLVYGSTGLAQTGLYAMAQIWNVEGAARPNFVTRLLRSLLFLVLLGVGLVLTTVLSGFGTFGRHNATLGYGAEVVAALVNLGLFYGAFRILTPRTIDSRDLVPGAVFGAIGWTIVQALGGYVVGHDLKGASATYGMFGLVLGLVAWIALGATLVTYAAELNVVRARRLYPRAMIQPPLTEADQRSIAAQALEQRRRPGQTVTTTIGEGPMTEDEYRANNYEVGDPPATEHKSAGADKSDEAAPGARTA